MGFYAPAQIVRDAREHGVEVRPVDVNFSDWDCTLEPLTDNPLRPGEGRDPPRQSVGVASGADDGPGSPHLDPGLAPG